MDVYNNVAASLIKYCNEFLQRNSLTATFEPYDFDAFATEGQLPDAPLIGITEYSIENLDRHYMVTVMFVVCTTAEDDGLQLLRQTVGALFAELKVGDGAIKVVDAKTGDLVGNLTIMESIKVLPVARTETRPIQMIAVSFGSSFLTPP